MSLYKACLIGSDIGRAPYFELTAHTLRGAKRQATALFGNGFAHHTIAVFETYNAGTPQKQLVRVADKLMFARKWTNRF